MNTPTYVEVSGSPGRVGASHGSALAGRLRRFIDDSSARLGYLNDKPIDLDMTRNTIIAHRDTVTRHLPALAEEVDGLAVGAGIERDEAWLLQLRRELLGYSRITSGDCTTYASVQGRAVLAQTVDLNGNLDDQIAVLSVSGPRHRSLVLSFAGLLGYLGVNESGVAVGLNLVLGGLWRPGIPPYLAIRHVLDSADDVESAVEILCELPLSSSRAFTVAGTEGIVCVEALGSRRRKISEKTVAHTNHFLHPDFAVHDEINVFAKNSSKRRLQAVKDAGIPDTLDGHRRLLSTPPIFVADNGDIRRERTVGAVVLYPDTGEMVLWPGDPGSGPTYRWSL